MKFTQLITIVLLMGVTLSCSAEANKNKEEKNTKEIQQAEEVEVYYFHNTRRCATCKAVESVSKEAVKELDNENVSFTALNVEKTEGEEKAKELGISGQTLLIVSGDKKINITRESFLHARSNPEKLKQIVQEKISSLL
jgi:thiol-disulfide isomerase/thioredoxin